MLLYFTKTQILLIVICVCSPISAMMAWIHVNIKGCFWVTTSEKHYEKQSNDRCFCFNLTISHILTFSLIASLDLTSFPHHRSLGKNCPTGAGFCPQDGVNASSHSCAQLQAVFPYSRKEKTDKQKSFLVYIIHKEPPGKYLGEKNSLSLVQFKEQNDCMKITLSLAMEISFGRLNSLDSNMFLIWKW